MSDLVTYLPALLFCRNSAHVRRHVRPPRCGRCRFRVRAPARHENRAEPPGSRRGPPLGGRVVQHDSRPSARPQLLLDLDLHSVKADLATHAESVKAPAKRVAVRGLRGTSKRAREERIPTRRSLRSQGITPEGDAVAPAVLLPGLDRSPKRSTVRTPAGARERREGSPALMLSSGDARRRAAARGPDGLRRAHRPRVPGLARRRHLCSVPARRSARRRYASRRRRARASSTVDARAGRDAVVGPPAPRRLCSRHGSHCYISRSATAGTGAVAGSAVAAVAVAVGDCRLSSDRRGTPSSVAHRAPCAGRGGVGAASLPAPHAHIGAAGGQGHSAPRVLDRHAPGARPRGGHGRRQVGPPGCVRV